MIIEFTDKEAPKIIPCYLFYFYGDDIILLLHGLMKIHPPKK